MQTRGEFLEYLMEALIPDLRESGANAMADDLQRCVDIITVDGITMDALGSRLITRAREG